MELEKDIQELQALFQREEVQESVIANVLQFEQAFKGSWFTLGDCIKRVVKEGDTPELRLQTTESVVNVIRALLVCGFLLSKERGGVEQFRISGNKFKKILDAADRLKENRG